MKLESAFIGQRLLGAEKYVIRLDSMWLINKCRKITFVSGNSKDKRVSLPESKEELQKMKDGHEEIWMIRTHERCAAGTNNLMICT